jgi:hypothetical protein
MSAKSSSKCLALATSVITSTVYCPAIAQAAVIGFVDNPTGNSTDWNSFVTNVGASINTNVNFDTHPLGALQSDFYSASDGVTFANVNFGIVGAGTGSQTGSLPGPRSSGEGNLGQATYLRNSNGAFSFTVSFDEAVTGVGLMTADYFNPFGNNTASIEAFSGVNGTGQSLGRFNASALNFQLNNLYFMGLADTQDSIRSVVLSGPGLFGDTVYIDQIAFARLGTEPETVPEPLGVLAIAVCGLGLTLRCKYRVE